MSDLPPYPDDPIQEKDMQSFTVLCTQKEATYKKYSDKIMLSCTDKSKTPIKIQKLVIDKIKEIIKANPKKHSALQKFFALKLLNKIIIKKNSELNIYVEEKILSRLTILAEFNNDSSEKSAQALLTRGKNIFGPEEKDSQSSANFLIILLDCIEKWALTFQFEDAEVNDTLSTSTKSKASTGDKFYKSYTKLLEKGVKFPSTFKQLSAQKQSSSNSLKSEPTNLQKDQGKKKEQAGTMDPQSIEPQQLIEQSKHRQSVVSDQQYDDTKSMSNQSTFSNQSLTLEKKTHINKLKKKMQSVKESSKQIKKQVQDQLTNKIYTKEKLAELQSIQQIIVQFSKQCEDAISELMSDEIQPYISNSEQLIQKMFGYSEIFAIALNDINSIIQNQKSKLKKSSEVVKQTKHNEEDEDEDLRKAIEESKQESLKLQKKHVENKQSEKPNKNQFYEEEKKQEVQEENPFNFQNYENKEMFGTQIQQNLQFEDLNNQKFVFGQQDQEIQGSQIHKYSQDTPRTSFNQNQSKKNDFGFNFDFPQNQKKSSPKKQNKIKQQHFEDDQIQQKNLNKEDEIMEHNFTINENEVINFQKPKSQSVKQMKSQQNENYMEQQVFNFNNSELQNNKTQEESGEGMVYQNELTNEIDDQIQEQNPGFEEYQTQVNPRNSIKGVNQSLTNKNKQTSLFQSPVKNLLKSQQYGADQFNFADPAVNGINQFKTSIPQKQNFQSNDFQFEAFNFQTQIQQKPQQQSNDFDFNFNDFQAPKNIIEDFKDQQIQNQTYQNQNEKNNKIEKQVDQYIQQEQELEEFLRKSKLGSKLEQIHQKEFLEDQNKNIVQENFINNQRLSDSQTPVRSSLKKNKKDLQIEMREFSEPRQSVFKDQSPFQNIEEVLDFPNTMKNQKDLDQEQKLIELKYQMKQIHVQQWWKQMNTEQNYNDDIDHTSPYAQQKNNDQFQNIIEEFKESIHQNEKVKEVQKSFDLNIKEINNELQQMKTDNSKFVARISELEYEIESFNSQIVLIRQECEKELRNKESECSIMQRNISAMKIEVQTANDLQARCKSIEDNYTQQLNEKDRLYQQSLNEQMMLKQEMGVKQRQIDNFDADKMDMLKSISNLQNQLADEIADGNKSQDAILNQQNSKEKQDLISKIRELENQILKMKSDSSQQQQSLVPLLGLQQQMNSFSNEQKAQQNYQRIPQQINFLVEPQTSPQKVASTQQIIIQQSPYTNIIESSNNSQLNRQSSFLLQNSSSPNLQASSLSDQLQRQKSQNYEIKSVSPMKNENPFSQNTQVNQLQQSYFNLNLESEQKSQLSTKSENRLSIGSTSQQNIDMSQPQQIQPQQMSFGNIVQNMQTQNSQLILLKQKLFNFHINSLLQGQKCVIYEDVHVKIGLIRNIIMPKINPLDPFSNEIKTLFKIFLRNQNQQQLLLNYVNLQFVFQKNVQQSANIARILKSSHALPLEFPNQNALKQNETIEIDMEITLSPNQKNVQNMSIIDGLKNLTFGSIQLNLQYELSNSKKSGTLPVQVPFNIMHFLEPLGSLINYEFKGLWNKIFQQEQRKSIDLYFQKIFVLDKQKVQNMQRLLQVVTMNNVCFSQIKEVDTQPNIINFAAQLKILNQNNQISAERTWVLMKMELTKEGSNCKLAVVSANDHYLICQNVMETILGLISAQ